MTISESPSDVIEATLAMALLVAGRHLTVTQSCTQLTGIITFMWMLGYAQCLFATIVFNQEG